jgi:hypothetical protein
MRGDDGIPRTGRTERPAHHGGIGRQDATAGGYGPFAHAREAVPLENFELAAVHLLTGHGHIVGSSAILQSEIVNDRSMHCQSW